MPCAMRFGAHRSFSCIARRLTCRLRIFILYFYFGLLVNTRGHHTVTIFNLCHTSVSAAHAPVATPSPLLLSSCCHSLQLNIYHTTARPAWRSLLDATRATPSTSRRTKAFQPNAAQCAYSSEARNIFYHIHHHTNIISYTTSQWIQVI